MRAALQAVSLFSSTATEVTKNKSFGEELAMRISGRPDGTPEFDFVLVKCPSKSVSSLCQLLAMVATNRICSSWGEKNRPPELANCVDQLDHENSGQ